MTFTICAMILILKNRLHVNSDQAGMLFITGGIELLIELLILGRMLTHHL